MFLCTKPITLFLLASILILSASPVISQDVSKSNVGSMVQSVNTVQLSPQTVGLTLPSFKTTFLQYSHLSGDNKPCQDVLYNLEAEKCYNASYAKWGDGTTEKDFCCFTHVLLECMYAKIPTYCDEKGKIELVAPSKQDQLYSDLTSPTQYECGSYSNFWHCKNGIPIVTGTVCAFVVILIIVVGGTIFFLHKRRRSSNLGRSDNL